MDPIVGGAGCVPPPPQTWTVVHCLRATGVCRLKLFCGRCICVPDGPRRVPSSFETNFNTDFDTDFDTDFLKFATDSENGFFEKGFEEGVQQGGSTGYGFLDFLHGFCYGFFSAAFLLRKT